MPGEPRAFIRTAYVTRKTIPTANVGVLRQLLILLLALTLETAILNIVSFSPRLPDLPVLGPDIFGSLYPTQLRQDGYFRDIHRIDSAMACARII